MCELDLVSNLKRKIRKIRKLIKKKQKEHNSILDSIGNEELKHQNALDQECLRILFFNESEANQKFYEATKAEMKRSVNLIQDKLFARYQKTGKELDELKDELVNLEKLLPVKEKTWFLKIWSQMNRLLP